MAERPAAEPGKENGMAFGAEFRQQWALILVLFLMQVFAFGFPTFALPFVYAGATDEFGWTRQQAVLLASFKFYISAAAALVVGRMLDTINPKYVVAVSAVLGALAMAGFMVADNLPIYYALGIAHAGFIVSGAVLLKHRYGPQNLGLNLGIFTLCVSVGFGFLPQLMARMADTSGSYSGAFAMGTAAVLIAAVLLYPVKPRFWSRQL